MGEGTGRGGGERFGVNKDGEMLGRITEENRMRHSSQGVFYILLNYLIL